MTYTFAPYSVTVLRLGLRDGGGTRLVGTNGGRKGR